MEEDRFIIINENARYGNTSKVMKLFTAIKIYEKNSKIHNWSHRFTPLSTLMSIFSMLKRKSFFLVMF